MTFGLERQIKALAREIGFDLVGITTAQPPQHSQHLQQWLAKDFHGEMSYLARNADKRVDPSKILDDARSIVVVGLNYYTGDHNRTGRVARYAWGTRDYHEVLSEKLEQLAGSIAEIGGPGTRCLGYVDTGPILERDFAQRAGIGFIGKHTNLISRQFGNCSWLCRATRRMGGDRAMRGTRACRVLLRERAV